MTKNGAINELGIQLYVPLAKFVQNQYWNPFNFKTWSH